MRCFRGSGNPRRGVGFGDGRWSPGGPGDSLRSRPRRRLGAPFASPHARSIAWDHLLRQRSDWEGTLWGKPDWADRPSGERSEWLTRERHAPGEVYECNDVRVNLLALAATNVWRRPLPEVLREGRWGDRQVLSREWIRMARTPTPAQPGYGFMNLFLNPGRERFPSAPETAFAHLGAGTNMVYVAPEHDLVVVARWIRRDALAGLVARVLAAIRAEEE